MPEARDIGMGDTYRPNAVLVGYADTRKKQRSLRGSAVVAV